MALEALDNSENSNLTNPLSSLSKVDPTQQKIIDAQDELTKLIGNRGGGTPWFRLASGFLKPTRSGSFGESVGNAAEGMANYQEEQQKQEIPLAQAKIGILQNQYANQKEQQTRALLPQLYTTTKDSSGVDKYVFNPMVAQRLGEITGDPKYLSMIPEEGRKNQLQIARDNLFKNPDGTTGFNPKALPQLYSLDPKEALDTAKSAPEFRRMGILPTTGAEGTPFDALALTLEGPFKDQAVLLANRYKAGLIKDEDADKMANQLLTASTSHMDRATAQAQVQATHALTNALGQSRIQETKDQNQWKRTDAENKEQQALDAKNKDLEAKRSLANDTAQNTLDAVNTIRNHPGRMNGFASYDPRQIVPSAQHDFIKDMEGLKSSVFSSAIQNMKGMGSLSDAEGKKIQTLYGSLDPSLSKEAFDRTLDTIVKSMNQARDRANKQYAPIQAPKPQASSTDIHSQAVDWAKAHPNDPKSKIILEANGVK
jgi:hypothetical protein